MVQLAHELVVLGELGAGDGGPGVQHGLAEEQVAHVGEDDWSVFEWNQKVFFC